MQRTYSQFVCRNLHFSGCRSVPTRRGPFGMNTWTHLRASAGRGSYRVSCTKLRLQLTYEFRVLEVQRCYYGWVDHSEITVARGRDRPTRCDR